MSAPTLEQQLDAIMSASLIETMQITAQREPDGSVRFYTVMHDGGLCAFSDMMNLPNVREAIESGITALNAKRTAVVAVPELVLMGQAA